MAVTKADIISKTTNEFMKWVNYTEKSKASDLNGRDYDNPGPYNEHAGYNNYTVFADLYREKTGINVQGQAWCDTFVDTVFIHLFGVDMAKKLLGGFSAYTPTSANYFKNMGRWHTSNPQAGDIIFFKNSQRINHTGYVRSVSGGKVYTVEGNTSAINNVVEPNGGCVAAKSYDLTNSRIAGYGRPDYSLAIVNEEYYEGWLKAADNKRWWYQFKDGSYARNDGKNNGWYQIGDFWYAFDANGYMLTGAQEIAGSKYYLCEEVGSDEGKLMATYGNSNGKIGIWNIKETPANNASSKKEGWLRSADGVRWWYQFKDGTYARNDGKNDGLYQINGYTYLFDKDGYMLTGLHIINGKEYFFWSDPNSPDNGKLMVTYENSSGCLTPWNRNDPREV